MSQDTHQYPLRLPADLRDRLDAAAAASGRSRHAEILARLKDSFEIGQKGATRLVAKDIQAEYKVVSDAETQMLSIFRKWPPDKQLSFLVLFR